MDNKDEYIHEMDWGNQEQSFSQFINYRAYQFNLIQKFIGVNILEVGSGDRSFTRQIVQKSKPVENLLSIEPSTTLFELYKNSFKFPDYVQFKSIDLFKLGDEYKNQFDTIIFIHVLEHIEFDREALNFSCELLKENGRILIEVPAMPWLFSVHDESLGHFRRYNKDMLRSIVDERKFTIEKLWYQDPIGILGSLYFFKIRKIKLKSDKGQNLVSNQGNIYNSLIIPIEQAIERLITFPFGLSLTAIIKKH